MEITRLFRGVRSASFASILVAVTMSTVAGAASDAPSSAAASVAGKEDKKEACVPAGHFTDKDYEALKAQYPEFLIYFWSPFMPLSVRGRNEIEKLAQEMKIPKVVGVLDFSPRVCHKASGIFADPAFDSKELARDHALNHFPTLLYVRNSQVEAQLPGYDLPEKFKARIQKIREEKDKKP